MDETITLEGKMAKLGVTDFQYGSHYLVSIDRHEDNGQYVLTSDDFPLDDVVGQNVRVSGTPVEGYPQDGGGPRLLNVTEISEIEIEKGGEGRPDRGYPQGEG